MELHQYKHENVVEAFCSNSEDVFLETLMGINNNKEFETDLENVNSEVKDKCKGESLLHRVLKYKHSIVLNFVRNIVDKKPQLLEEQRDSKEISHSDVDNFRGQTPLHVAIVNGYAEAVKAILIIADAKNMTQELLSIPATGKKFKNTVLMGQLPLSAAALACRDEDRDVLNILFEYAGTHTIPKKNQEGDTVFHSLIKYADIHSDKMQHIEPTFKFIWDKFAEDCKKLKLSKVTDILFWENEAGVTPLQLSAKLGVSELFNFLINIEGVYCINNVKDGLFDIRKYDVTEFDRLISHKENLEDIQKRKISILESIFHSKCTHKEAFQILNQELVKFILDKKWKAYRLILYLWMFLHIVFMCVFTASTIEKSHHYFLSQDNETSISLDVGEFSTAVVALFLLGGLIYLFFSCLCIKELVRRCRAEHGSFCNSGIIFHNIDYILCLLITSVGALVEFVLILLKIHWDYHLVFTLIFGWYFMLYFAPIRKEIVSFTYMIKAGFWEDFVPFAYVYFCLLISFTTSMYMLFRGTDGADDFETFGSSLLAMFKLGVGLNDIGMLNQSRIPELAYTLFVVYVVLSFIQLLNALIAVMSDTFSAVHVDRNSLVLYNKLKMVELFEDIVLFRVKSKYPFAIILNRAEHWDKDDEDSGNKKSRRSVRIEIFKKGKQETLRQVRFYSTMELDDLEDNRDDKEEKKRKMNKTIADQMLEQKIRKIKKKASKKKSSKTNPDRDIIYVNVQKFNKSSQYPEDLTLSK